jgi:hypothetical protein
MNFFKVVCLSLGLISISLVEGTLGEGENQCDTPSQWEAR